MSNESFRLESFRPWNPHEKPLSQQGPLDLRRYPSPVSLNATPSPNNSKDSTIHSQIPHVPKLERHPLPVRPPIEVCVDESSQSVDQNIRKPDLDGEMSPVNQDSDNLDFEEILHLENPPSCGHIGDMVFDSVDEHFEQRTRIGSCDLEPSFTPDQVSQSMVFQNPTPPGMEDFASDLTIDPAMLEDHHCRAGEQQNTTESAPSCTTREAGSPVVNHPWATDDGSSRGRQCHSPKAPGRRSSKIQKVSVVISNHQKDKHGKSTRRPGHQEASLSTILAQFSALKAEDRLQFLSWLFEGALSRCLPRPGEVSTKSRSMPSDNVSSSSTQNASADSCSSRKRLRYSAEENYLLIQLKEKEGLRWEEVIRRFDENYPGRSPQSIKVHWSTKLSKRKSSGLCVTRD
ncbi:hypothetical protein N7509_000306 [Penicillium cosmopolitanum]|uniref:Myb-like domain-containing protein n=1 Tax=Penicillium cosmopolitanum TaxID=1131564 RepID=A0A9W9WA17_9EURO|nr:uncharacterized protein N7509_000306 [Penicillium cosmopolitanum]KAJ5413679.1 hypothetical protein N7509_000306 [Penicillium cosmopolitanum]